MINKNELRIGNYLESDGRDIMISGHYLSNMEKGMKPDNPIPITEEWLLNFGFKKIPDGWYMFAEKDYIKFHISYITESVIYFYCCGRTIPLKYVHQVQNIYFALTGEELTLSVT